METLPVNDITAVTFKHTLCGLKQFEVSQDRFNILFEDHNIVYIASGSRQRLAVDRSADYLQSFPSFEAAFEILTRFDHSK